MNPKDLSLQESFLYQISPAIKDALLAHTNPIQFEKYQRQFRGEDPLDDLYLNYLEGLNSAPALVHPMTVFTGFDDKTVGGLLQQNTMVIATSPIYDVAKNYSEKTKLISRVELSPGVKVIYISMLGSNEPEIVIPMVGQSLEEISSKPLKLTDRLVYVSYISGMR